RVSWVRLPRPQATAVSTTPNRVTEPVAAGAAPTPVTWANAPPAQARPTRTVQGFFCMRCSLEEGAAAGAASRTRIFHHHFAETVAEQPGQPAAVLSAERHRATGRVLDLCGPQLAHLFLHRARHGHVVQVVGRLVTVLVRPVEELLPRGSAHVS